MENISNKIYARPDESGTVIKFFSTVFEQPQTGDILIEEGNEDHHAHVHLKYQLTDEHGRYNYRIVSKKLKAIPEKNKSPLSGPPQTPTLEDRVSATEDALLAIMTGGMSGV